MIQEIFTSGSTSVPPSFAAPVAVAVPSAAHTLPRQRLSSKHPKDRAYYVVKRIFDVVLAAPLLIILAPVFLVIALFIKLDSAGPAFFVHQRVGSRRPRRNGEGWEVVTFPFIKFRSMYANADENVHKKYIEDWAARQACDKNTTPKSDSKLVNDKRITRVGHWLRKTSLDELPQLVNILLGQMSFVGPRPVPVYEAAKYVGEHWQRLCTPPGLTGLWQVEGRGEVTFEEMMKLDSAYIRNRSLRTDLKILGMTLPAVLSAKGAK